MYCYCLCAPMLFMCSRNTCLNMPTPILPTRFVFSRVSPSACGRRRRDGSKWWTVPCDDVQEDAQEDVQEDVQEALLGRDRWRCVILRCA